MAQIDAPQRGEISPPSLIIRSLHWLIAVLVVFQGLLGYANLHVAWFHARLATGIYVHEEVGLSILVLTIWMLLQRVLEGRGSGYGLESVQAKLAGYMHLALYLLIFVQSFLGIWMMGLLGRGLKVFVWNFALPIAPDPLFVFGGLLQIHAAVAGLLALAIVGHSLAALHHHFVLHDDVLKRMSLRRRSLA